MYILPAQYDGFRVNSVGDRKVTLSMDETIDLGEFNPARVKKGTQFIVVLLDENEINRKIDILESVKERLNNKLHAMIYDLAEKEGISADKMKDRIKKEQKIKHVGDLSIKDLAKLANIVSQQING